MVRGHAGIAIGLCSSLALLVACKSSTTEHGVQAGELGRGTFTYSCGSGADAECNDNSDLAIVDPATNLPSVAVGATFSIGYKSNQTNAVGISQSGDLDLLAVDSKGSKPGFLAKRAGFVAVVGVYLVNEDLVHVHVEELDHLEFANTTPTAGGSFKGAVTVPGLTVSASAAVAPTMLLRVVPMTKDRRLLAGALACQWTSTDPTLIQIDGPATQNIVSIKLLKSGTGKLHVTLGTLASDVTLTVGS